MSALLKERNPKTRKKREPWRASAWERKQALTAEALRKDLLERVAGTPPAQDPGAGLNERQPFYLND